jgi:hypothetical protein
LNKLFILTIAVLCLAFKAVQEQPVSLSLIVTDKNNKGVSSIRKEQIHVFEDKVEQELLAVEPDERPVDCGIVIDASGSFRRLIVSSLESVRLIIKNKRPADEVFHRAVH